MIPRVLLMLGCLGLGPALPGAAAETPKADPPQPRYAGRPPRRPPPAV